MTCYDCGRQPGDVCKREDGCTAQDAPIHSALATRLAAPVEPVAWMFVTRHKRTGRRDEFAAIDWLPEPGDERELIEKRPLVYAHPVQPADAQADALMSYLRNVLAEGTVNEKGVARHALLLIAAAKDAPNG